MSNLVIIGNNHNFRRECKSMEDAQSFLKEEAYRLVNSNCFDEVRIEYFIKGHKYEGLISSVFWAYGVHGFRFKLKEE